MMSNIISKTFNLAVSSISAKVDTPIDSYSFLQSIATLQNQSLHICNFLNQVKKHFTMASVDQQCKYLKVITYCAYLGSAENAIKDAISELGPVIMTFIEQSKVSFCKKHGYLALTALIGYGNSDLVYLSVNTILKDATSKQKDVILMSLNAIANIVTTDLIPVFLPVVEKRLGYSDVSVRKKAFNALHCMLKVGSEFVKNTKNHVKAALSDRSPEVMAFSLPYVYQIVKKDPASYVDLPPVLMVILNQVVQGKLPMHMSLHGLPAPFAQIFLLKILHHLTLSDEIKATLADTLLNILNHCQASKYYIVNAVLYECFHSALTFYEKEESIFKAAIVGLGTFLNSSDVNLLSTGISLLVQVAKIKSSYCIQYQSTIINCLSHPDITIKKQTVVLLQALVNKNNCKVICKHIIAMLDTYADYHYTRSLTENIAAIAEKFSSDLSWLLETLHILIEKSGESTSEIVCARLLKQVNRADVDHLVAELQHCMKLLNGQMSFFHYKVIALIVSKHLKNFGKDLDEAVQLILQQTNKQLDINKIRSDEISFILISFTKQLIIYEHEKVNLIEKVKAAVLQSGVLSPAVNQSLFELEVMANNEDILQILSDGNDQVDETFSFLEAFSEELDVDEENTNIDEHKEVAIKTQPYTVLMQPVIRTKNDLMASMLAQGSGPSLMGESFLSREATDQGVAVWKKEGYQPPQTDLSLNQALRNLSTVADTPVHDQAVFEMVNEVFGMANVTDVSGAESNNR